MFAALGDLVTRVEHNPAAHDQLYAMLSYLIDEQGHDEVFRTVLTTLADQAQLLLDDRDLVPIVHVFGAAMDPANATVEAGVALVKRSHDLDTDKALLTILRNLYQPGPHGVVPASDLADIASEMNRTVPGHGGDFDAGDEHTLLDQLHGFVSDNLRGFTRFLPSCSTATETNHAHDPKCSRGGPRARPRLVTCVGGRHVPAGARRPGARHGRLVRRRRR